MSEERKAILAQHRAHRLEVEESLFRVIQKFSAKGIMSADDVNALAAIAEAFVDVQKMVY